MDLINPTALMARSAASPSDLVTTAGEQVLGLDVKSSGIVMVRDGEYRESA
jgi:hypothetical protein